MTALTDTYALAFVKVAAEKKEKAKGFNWAGPLTAAGIIGATIFGVPWAAKRLGEAATKSIFKGIHAARREAIQARRQFHGGRKIIEGHGRVIR